MSDPTATLLAAVRAALVPDQPVEEALLRMVHDLRASQDQLTLALDRATALPADDYDRGALVAVLTAALRSGLLRAGVSPDDDLTVPPGSRFAVRVAPETNPTVMWCEDCGQRAPFDPSLPAVNQVAAFATDHGCPRRRARERG